MIGARTAVALVARREVQTRIRSKAFTIVLAITALAFIALPLVFKLADQGPDTREVAVSDAAFGKTLSAAAEQLDQPLTLRTVADAQAGAALVRDGDADAYAATTTRPGDLAVTVHESLPDDLRTLFSVVQQRGALDAQVRQLGGDPAQVTEALAGTELRVQTQEKTDPQRGQKLAVAMSAGLLMYMILMTVGQMVAQGVVEEKSSRVVELLLAAVRPWQLMGGKILGIGALGLVQLLVPGALALAVGIGIDVLDVSLANSVGTLLWTLVWFVTGFALYAMLFAAAGATVSRQEDLNGLVLPIMMPLIVGWVIGATFLPDDPDNVVATVASFLPPLAPVLMPMRWALGVAPWWEVLASLALTVLVSALMLRFAGRIYRNSVLRSGARVPWREAFRAA